MKDRVKSCREWTHEFHRYSIRQDSFNTHPFSRFLSFSFLSRSAFANEKKMRSVQCALGPRYATVYYRYTQGKKYQMQERASERLCESEWAIKKARWRKRERTRKWELRALERVRECTPWSFAGWNRKNAKPQRDTIGGKLIAEIWVQCKRVPRSRGLTVGYEKRKEDPKVVWPRGLCVRRGEGERKNGVVPMTRPRSHKSAISSGTLSRRTSARALYMCKHKHKLTHC